MRTASLPRAIETFVFNLSGWGSVVVATGDRETRKGATGASCALPIRPTESWCSP